MSRDRPRTILHVDMDAFFAAVEQRDHPELRGKPVIVGADPKGGRGRGVVSTASYEARRFGVGSAMPISEAWRRCPHGVYVHPDIEKYARESDRVMEILHRFTDLVEPVSIDEAFLDVTGSARALGTGEEIATKLKAAIRDETRLTASVGVAASKLVAKIASDMRKPDGLVIVPPGGEAAFLAPLPIRRLWGVGPKMEEALARLGIATIGDLAAVEPGRLARRLGTHGHDLQSLARGEDDRDVVSEGEGAKSLGQEHTYGQDTADPERLRATLLQLADAVAARLRSHGLRARTVTLKYRDEDFHTTTHARTLGEATDSGDAIFRLASELFAETHRGRKVRLLGIYTSHFGEGTPQLGLFEEPKAPSPADRVRDEVRKRFGDEAITRASLLGRRERRNPSDKPPR
ncbi:MAG TPA: DNA polymerase IV [Vicinamibacteria bacterium]|nr:DNA polymerase IV [Vicinamibacteria bacterium]